MTGMSRRGAAARRSHAAWMLLLALTAVTAGEVTYDYDQAGRMRSVTYPDGTRRIYTLDPAGNRTQVQNALRPPAPTNLQASVISSTQINLSWTAVTAPSGTTLAGYRVFRNSVQIATTTGTTYNNTGLTANTAYTFTVAAYNTLGGVSPLSNPASATTLQDTTAPTTPSALGATAASPTQINLTWTGSTDSGGSGLAGYKIYRNDTQIATSATTTYASAGLSPSTLYRYKVAAYDNAGNTSALSNESSATTLADTTPPTVPTGLTATAASSTQINLSWTASTDSGSGVAGYRIYRNGTQIDTSTTTSYSNTGLSPSTSYNYTVAAYDAVNNVSAQSSSRSATTLADTTAPTTPGGLAGTAVSASQINLTWNAATDSGGSGLAGYRLYRNGTQIAQTTSTSASDTGRTEYTSYNYTVRSYDNAGNQSPLSSAVAVRTLDVTAPTVPGTPTAPHQPVPVNLSWTASSDPGTGSGLAGYKIYRNGAEIATSTMNVFIDTGAQNWVEYRYRVAAYDNSGNTSALSGELFFKPPDLTPPTTPTNAVATAASSSLVNVTWTASTDSGGSGLNSYLIYRNGGLLTGVPGTSYADNFVSAGTTYNYQIVATDGAGNFSALSNTATVTTPSAGPSAAPTWTSWQNCTQIDQCYFQGNFTLTWAAPTQGPAPTRYDLEITPPFGAASVIDVGNVTSRVIDPTPYGPFGPLMGLAFRVRGCNSSGCGPWSGGILLTYFWVFDPGGGFLREGRQ